MLPKEVSAPAVLLLLAELVLEVESVLLVCDDMVLEADVLADSVRDDDELATVQIDFEVVDATTLLPVLLVLTPLLLEIACCAAHVFVTVSVHDVLIPLKLLLWS